VTDDSLWGRLLSSKSVSRFQTDLVILTGSETAIDPSASTQGATPMPISITIAPAGGEQGGFVAVISDIAHVTAAAPETTARIAELEQGLSEMARALDQARSSEARLRATAEELKAAEAEARSSMESSRRQEEDIRREFERIKDEEAALRKSAQQLLEINRLKSEFIVNAGRELEASLQSVLGFSELLERGSYGILTGEQMEAVRGIYNNARRMKQDVEWLVEYGSTRSRRLEPGSENKS
ncbi:MAG TPA: hypothetical protein VFQ92_02055, partial [Blastocatellia bacterium]|nr:hypothetical protein [Blastocatellia bacterium]